MGTEALQVLLKGRPDTSAENPKYIAEMVECLAWLSREELSWLTHPRTGLHTTLKFLPTPADVHTFIRERREKADQFKPAHTSWRKIEDDPNAPWNRETDAERKARVVKELLGYNPSPSARKIEPKRELVPPTADDLANLDLKTPPSPPSVYLKNLLRAQGYPHLKDEA